MKVDFFSPGDKWNLGIDRGSFVNPVGVAQFKNGILYISGKKFKTDNPLSIIEKYLLKKRVYAVGFVSYDFKKYTLKVSSVKNKKKKIGLPDIFFLFFRSYGKFENIKNKPPSKIDSVNFETEKGDFIKKVITAKSYIEKGDIYQINLSHRIRINGFFNTDRVFQDLISYQPAPYMMHIKTHEFSVISGSMELFLEKRRDMLRTVPIKGTRPSGKSDKETKKYKNELLNSPKERAENLMITDLMRNDIGKISIPRSVNVEKLFDVKSYRSVLQMESVVTGKLNKGVSLGKIFDAVFPPGSVTGAPKKRAVEIIDMLEDHKREVYCGCIAVIKPDLDFVLSVAIRQSVFSSRNCYIYVGSGIVADSDPEKEYEETLIKARANLKALGIDLDTF